MPWVGHRIPASQAPRAKRHRKRRKIKTTQPRFRMNPLREETHRSATEADGGDDAGVAAGGKGVSETIIAPRHRLPKALLSGFRSRAEASLVHLPDTNRSSFLGSRFPSIGEWLHLLAKSRLPKKRGPVSLSSSTLKRYRKRRELQSLPSSLKMSRCLQKPLRRLSRPWKLQLRNLNLLRLKR